MRMLYSSSGKMPMNEFFVSTIDEKAGELARHYGLGIEIAEFCTAWNMDERLEETEKRVQAQVREIPNRVLHAPFSELFPCAIDPLVRKTAAYRYRQAIALARNYGAQKVVIHGGFYEKLYFPEWFTEQSILFWKDFLKEDPGVELVLENVLEPEPGFLKKIVEAVDHPKLKLCLDVGHVNAYSKIPVMDWLEDCGPYASHFHLHNNDGTWDTHSALAEGTIPMETLLEKIRDLCPGATVTLELMEAESSIKWLLSQKIIKAKGENL